MERPKSKKSDSRLKRLVKRIEDELKHLQFDAFLIAPVKEGLIKYTDLVDGGLTLFDIQKMHDAIDFYKGVDRIVHEFNRAEINQNNKIKRNGGKIR